MKTIGLIILGSILTLASQFYNLPNFILNEAQASNEEPCVILISNQRKQKSDGLDEINENYRKGYRVKGVGAHSYTNNVGGVVVVMCKE